MLTFIIPTIGRESLKYTIDSLYKQTIHEWKCIIIFDGIEPNIIFNDSRIKIIKCDKLGIGSNSAGNVRNYGMQFVETEWIAFVDDDDTISSSYIEIFNQEFKIYDFDVYIYRMQLNNQIIPSLNVNNFYVCDVGISFIIKKNIFDNIKFIPSSIEDFEYLNKIRECNYKIIISPYVKYYVKNNKSLKNTICNRIFINMYNHNPLILLLGYNYLRKET